jgi:tRNA uridine 5-carboxymethylaminomethyl modification enzyme
VKNEPALILDRTEAYTAILIDDLISKGTNEPYRMFTSRAEFRLHLRIDNADRRLTSHGRRVGLISDEAWADFQAKQSRLHGVRQLLEKTKLSSDMLKSLAVSSAKQPHNGEALPFDLTAALGQPLAQLLKRPEITIEQLAPVLREIDPAFFAAIGDSGKQSAPLTMQARNELKSVETEIKYAGYLQQQERSIERLKKSEQRNIPEWFDYRSVSGLSREMQEKLLKVRPRTLGHASRIPGVTPAAVSLVNVYIEIQARRRDQAGSLPQ